jgi:hypothetical protein
MLKSINHEVIKYDTFKVSEQGQPLQVIHAYTTRETLNNPYNLEMVSSENGRAFLLPLKPNQTVPNFPSIKKEHGGSLDQVIDESISLTPEPGDLQDLDIANSDLFENGGEIEYHQNVEKIKHQKFTEGFGKVKYFEITPRGGNWVYEDNPNLTKSEIKKSGRYIIDLPEEIRKKVIAIREEYEKTQPKPISIKEFAQKFKNANNAKITHSSKSGSVYLELPNKETVRISDHYVLDRDAMNPKSRNDWEIVQKYFTETDPVNLSYYLKNGGQIPEIEQPIKPKKISTYRRNHPNAPKRKTFLWHVKQHRKPGEDWKKAMARIRKLVDDGKLDITEK